MARRLLLAALALLFIAAAGAHAAVTLENAFPSVSIGDDYDTLGFVLVYLQTPESTPRHLAVFKKGFVMSWKDGDTQSTEALDISSLVVTINEQGLLGMALDDDWTETGYVYLCYTTAGGRYGLNAGDSVVSRWTMDTATLAIDDTSEHIILLQPQPYANHNGGMLLIEPGTGHLVIFFGDGGDGGDPQNRAQNTSTWLGKVLRIDASQPNATAGTNYSVPADNPFVGTDGYLPEIYAVGLRNPWRGSFDTEAPHWLWVGDVGQGLFEELDIVRPGLNYGWRRMEGFACYNPSSCNISDDAYTKPIIAYTHAAGGTVGGSSITGGGVYRDATRNNADLIGTVFYADYVRNRIFAMRYDGTDPANLTNVRIAVVANGVSSLVSFATTRSGDLYILSGQSIQRIASGSSIAANSFVAFDSSCCNGSGGGGGVGGGSSTTGGGSTTTTTTTTTGGPVGNDSTQLVAAAATLALLLAVGIVW